MSMKLEKPHCPTCGGLPVGTVDLIEGIALLSFKAEDNKEPGEAEYVGETKVDWDSQKTIDSEAGLLFQCEKYHRWHSRITESSHTPRATVSPED